jgi:hypothetical protein
MTKELDLISIVDSVRKANIICNLLLNKDQQMFVENQPHFTLGEEDKLDKFDYPKSEETSLDRSNIKGILERLTIDDEFDIRERFNKELISNIIELEDDYTTTRLEVSEYWKYKWDDNPKEL